MDVPLSSDALDLDWHPTEDLLTVALISGKVQIISYDQDKPSSSATTKPYRKQHTVRPTKKSARAIGFDHGQFEDSLNGQRVEI